MEVFQQIAEGGVLFLHIAEINLRVKVNGAEYIAQLAAVVLLNVGKGNVDLLTDFVIITVFIEKVKGGLLIDGKAFTAHGAFYAALIAIVLLQVLGTFFFGNVTQVFDKQHRQDIVLVAGAVDLSTEAVTGFPEDAFNIVTSSHFNYLSSFLCRHGLSADCSSILFHQPVSEGASFPSTLIREWLQFAAVWRWATRELRSQKNTWP